MKKRVFNWTIKILIGIAFVAIVLLGVNVSKGLITGYNWAMGDDDVYNFYFQKGGAPQSVIQGGRGQGVNSDEASKASPALLPKSEETKTPVTVASAPTLAADLKKQDYKSFNVLLGYGQISDEVGTSGAYSLGAQYNFNKFLGVRLQGHLTASETEKPTVKLADSNQSSNRYGGYGAVVFTPLHIELLGHQLIEVSALAGGMSYREHGEPVFDLQGSQNYNVRTSLRGFLGAAATFTLNENVGLELFASMVDGGKLGRVTGSLAFRF
jgi:hypothetical protein